MNRISAARIARLIGGWKTGQGTLPTQLAAAIDRLIEAHELPVGGTLPSERSLSIALATSRGTVVGAYCALRDAGLVDSRHGSGSRIAKVGNRTGTTHTRLPGAAPMIDGAIDMTSGALQPSTLLIDSLSSLRPSDLEHFVSGLGYDAAGLPALRCAIARYYTDLGLPTKAENILVTSGAQQAVWLIAGALIEPSDAVVVEDPTYRGSLEAFRRRNARLVPVSGSGTGIDLSMLERILSLRPKLLYLFPVSHNPTGRSLDRQTRHDIVGLLKRYPTFLVEDGSQSELYLGHDGPPPLAVERALEKTATIGTLSKLFWGGLRIGWVRASAAFIHQLTSLKAVNDLGGSVIDQHIAVRLLERIDEARDWRRLELTSHLDAAEEELARRGAGRWIWQRPSGGSAIWTAIPGVDAVSLCQRALTHGLILSAGPGYSATEGFSDCLRLPFVRSREAIRFTIETVNRLIA